jgi:microcystin-dependent protein
MSIPNSFSSGATASSSAVNANFNDIATEITGSLPRDGQAAMTGQMKAATGSAASPSITFGSDTDTGFYRKASGTIGIAVDGVEVAEISAKGSTLIPTGCLMPYGASAAPAGWVRANGRTIGNASSSATERANADTSDLFSFLWTNYADSICAVSSGRGASAAADYAANKTIALPDLRGRGIFGLDDMGNSAAGRLGSVITSATTNGASGGAETVTLAEGNLPSHSHSMAHTHSVSGQTSGQSVSHIHGYSGTTSSNGDHSHTYFASNNDNKSFSGSGSVANAGGTTASTGTTGAHTHTYSGFSDANNVDHNHTVSLTTGAASATNTGTTGSGTALANMPPAFLSTIIIKL